jgi:hypothetical protein
MLAVRPQLPHLPTIGDPTYYESVQLPQRYWVVWKCLHAGDVSKVRFPLFDVLADLYCKVPPCSRSWANSISSTFQRYGGIKPWIGLDNSYSKSASVHERSRNLRTRLSDMCPCTVFGHVYCWKSCFRHGGRRRTHRLDHYNCFFCSASQETLYVPRLLYLIDPSILEGPVKSALCFR